jgi:hypothetical protein
MLKWDIITKIKINSLSRKFAGFRVHDTQLISGVVHACHSGKVLEGVNDMGIFVCGQ